nr:MAG TPA: hypothetical protein [Caudoviricetes sp.]
MLIPFGVVFLDTKNHLRPRHYTTAGKDEQERGRKKDV